MNDSSRELMKRLDHATDLVEAAIEEKVHEVRTGTVQGNARSERQIARLAVDALWQLLIGSAE